MLSTAPSDFRLREQNARDLRIASYDALAGERARWQRKNRAYYRNIERLVRFVVPEGASVLEVGCGLGDLLAACKPSAGLGVHLSPRLVGLARPGHPELAFAAASPRTLEPPRPPG